MVIVNVEEKPPALPLAGLKVGDAPGGRPDSDSPIAGSPDVDEPGTRGVGDPVRVRPGCQGLEAGRAACDREVVDVEPSWSLCSTQHPVSPSRSPRTSSSPSARGISDALRRRKRRSRSSSTRRCRDRSLRSRKPRG